MSGIGVKTMSRVLIVSESPIFRSCVSLVLSRNVETTIAGETASIEEAVRLAHLRTCDLIVVSADTFCRRERGRLQTFKLDALRLLKQTCPGVAVLALEGSGSGNCASILVEAGADGYLATKSDSDELFTAIKIITRGGRYINSRMPLNGNDPLAICHNQSRPGC